VITDFDPQLLTIPHETDPNGDRPMAEAACLVQPALPGSVRPFGVHRVH